MPIQSQKLNYKKLSVYTNVIKGYNNYCGDEFYVYIFIKNNIIKYCSFHGYGCNTSIFSISLLTEVLKNKSVYILKKQTLFIKNFCYNKTYKINTKFFYWNFLLIFYGNLMREISCFIFPWKMINILLK